MALCGNICFSGFYGDDVSVQGSQWGKDCLTESYIKNSECVPCTDMARP